MSQNQNKPGRPVAIITPEGRLSFPVLFEPKFQEPGAPPKWSTVLLIPKSNPEVAPFLQRLAQDCEAAINREWPDPSKRPLKLRMPLKDGDTAECESGANAGRLRKDSDPNVAGCWILSASRTSKRRKDGAAIAPAAIIDPRGAAITDPSRVYGGVWARLQITVYPYANVNFGVGAWIESALIVRDDEPFAGVADPRSAFGQYLEADAPLQQAAAAASSAPRPTDAAKFFG